MTPLAWFALLEIVAIATLAVMLWRRTDERHEAREREPYVGAFQMHVPPESMPSGRVVFDLVHDGATGAEESEIVRMPASDRRVLEGMRDRDDTEAATMCTPPVMIASFAGVQRASVSRVTTRLVARGFIRPCELDLGKAWMLTDAGRAAVAP